MTRDDVQAELGSAHAQARDVLGSDGWCHLLSRPDRIDLAWVFAGTGTVARVVRGRKMTTWPDLYDEFAAAWQFPSYFGENDAAFDECLTDLRWQSTRIGYAVLVVEPELVLSQVAHRPGRPTEPLRDFVELLASAADEFRQGIPGSDAAARPPLRFDVVLLPEEDTIDRARHLRHRSGAPFDV